MIKKNFKEALIKYLDFLKENNIYQKKNLESYSTYLERKNEWKKKDELNTIIKW